MWTNPQETADLFTFTKEIFNEILTHQEYELKGMETNLYNVDSLEICRQLLAQELSQSNWWQKNIVHSASCQQIECPR